MFWSLVLGVSDMRVNPLIKEVLSAIAKESIINSNTPNGNRKYIKRFIDIYKNKLTEEEQIYLTEYILENIHYKTIVTDPDNVITMHSIRARNVTYVFIMVFITIILAGIVFRTNDTINGAVEAIYNLIVFLSL